MSILDAFAPYKLLIEIAVIGSLAGGVLYGAHQFLEHEREIGRNEIREADKIALQVAKDEATRLKGEMEKMRSDAIDKGIEREQTLRTVAAGGTAASLSLRDTLARISNGVSGSTVEALRYSTTTLATVLGDCQTRYRELAEKADRHASDAKTISDAWPTKTPAPSK